MLDDRLFHARSGTTDSELLFLLAMQFGMAANPIAAMAEAIGFVEGLSLHLTGSVLVRFTAAFSDGKSLYAIRYATDRKAPTLYASPVGSGNCLVSEPLNDDVDAWREIPDGSAVMVDDSGVHVMPFQPQARERDEGQPAVAIPA